MKKSFFSTFLYIVQKVEFTDKIDKMKLIKDFPYRENDYYETLLGVNGYDYNGRYY